MKAIHSKYDDEAMWVENQMSDEEKQGLIWSERQDGESDEEYSMRLIKEAIGRIN